MKRYFYIAIALLLLAGCSEQPSVESLIKSNLRDPDSAKFRNFIISKHKTMACIDWNARNSFGGYGEWDTARLINEGKGWSIVKMQINANEYGRWCPQQKMDSYEEFQAVAKDLVKEVGNGPTMSKKPPNKTINANEKPEKEDSAALEAAIAEAEAEARDAVNAAREAANAD
ncbi:MAG: lipoprotein [Methylophilaceae bacterium]